MEESRENGEAARIRAYFDEPPARWSRWAKGRQYLLSERRRLLLRAYELTREPIHLLTVCDVGCGDGADLAFWVGRGVLPANVAGTELSTTRAARARELLPEAEIADVTGSTLPFDSGRFALTSASLVFSLLRDQPQRLELFSEMKRVTLPGGVVAIYDFRVKNPLKYQVLVLTDARVRKLAGLDERSLAAPLLPILDGVLRLPAGFHSLARLLPKTHAMCVWQLPK